MSKVIKLGNYKGIEFKVEKVPVSNEEVEQQIQMILAQSSQTEEKDGDTVENGDIATIDFVGLKDVGDPIELAKKYDEQCADEVVFLDITASYEDRGIMKDIIERGASELTIPLAVGGGIRTLDDFR